MRASRLRSFLRLMAWSAITGSVVAVAAALLGVEDCGASNDCRALVRTLSIRLGIFTGVGTAVMALFVVGLGRTQSRNEADRMERLRESLGEQ
jgi:hypothetical protein